MRRRSRADEKHLRAILNRARVPHRRGIWARIKTLLHLWRR